MFQAIEEEKAKGRRVWESDINPTFRFLENNYPNDDDLPSLNISIYDIEVDKDPNLGFSTTDNPFCPIISITVYHKWLKQAITLAVPPPEMSMSAAITLCNDENNPDGYGKLNADNGYYLLDDEQQLLEIFAEIIQDTDIIAGWNSEFYDLPYIINRARIVIGGENIEKIRNEGTEFNPSEKSAEYIRKLSVFNVLPDVSFVENYGKRERTFQIVGRRHIDYLVFYKKFIKAELLSFTLDAILQHEVGQTKVKFDGSIDAFYRNKFRVFLAYNRQDVMGLSAIDDKRGLINMANQMIHMSGVTMDKSVGSVSIIEQAVLRELHRERKEIAWNRVEHKPDKHVPGAFVVEPKSGKYGWGGSYDVNSLYPTIIRLLNISPETLIGQLDTTRTIEKLNTYVYEILRIPIDEQKPSDPDYTLRNKSKNAIDIAYRDAWHKFTGVLEYHDVITESSNKVTLLFDDSSLTMTGKEMREYLITNNYCITANGTIFDLSKQGIIPYCLTKWYNERIKYRKKSQNFEKEALEFKKLGDDKKYKELIASAEFYDQIQNAKKLFLNSTYGAYLNRFFRFYDPRCGRSVTLSGRVVVKHMCRKSCELLSENNEYDFDYEVLLGGDTDSTYISYESFMKRNDIERNIDNAIAIGDWVGENINNSFKEYLSEQFLIPQERCEIVQVKRETIFDRAIFKDKKKRYAMHVIDKEGKIIPKGHKDELKIVGLEVKRSDTPKIIQDFLQECLRLVLVEGYEEEDLRCYVESFRKEFRKIPSWKRGSPIRLKKLQVSSEIMKNYDDDDDGLDDKKPNIYYVVNAANNTNLLAKRFGETRWEPLKDGDKVEFLYLKTNEYNMNSVAIRVGEDYIPEWFRNLPFDDETHETKLIDQKLENFFGGLGWDFTSRDHEGYDIFK
jgi:DNA polymerase elongation subunit (family B)